MRGKAPSGLLITGRGRITPAYAGKRFWEDCQQRENGDHPRICGEKFAVDVAPPSAVGSPPRMRGKGCIASEFARHSGITPAYAGKRTSMFSS